MDILWLGGRQSILHADCEIQFREAFILNTNNIILFATTFQSCDDTLRAVTLQCNYVWLFNYKVFSYLLCTFSVKSISSLACSVDLMLHLWYILLGSFKNRSLISPLWLWVSGRTLRFRKPDNSGNWFCLCSITWLLWEPQF